MCVLRRRRLAGEVEQHEALDHREAHLVQREARRVEVLRPVGERRVAQRCRRTRRSTRGTGTGGGAGVPVGLVDQPRAAVAAGVQERAREAVVVADDEHALAAGLDRQELPALATCST